MFDDAWLDDRQALAGADHVLRRLAESGARLRREMGEAAEPIRTWSTCRGRGRSSPPVRRRASSGPCWSPSARCPFVAWPAYGLPGWVGALDVVVVLASDVASPGLIASVHEAVRRGCQLVVSCPPISVIAEHAAGRSTIMLPARTGDAFAAAIVALSALHRMQLGPEVRPELVADAMDAVAEECSPFVDVAQNPAKDLAMGLAEAQPLVWGGSVLAARASRRIAEALRAATGRTALAADAEALLPVLDLAAPRDPFADPFEDGLGADRRPTLVMLDDGNLDDPIRVAQTRLLAAADRNDIRVCRIAHPSGSDVERYAALLQTGMFAAVYLAVGLGRYLEL